MEGRHAVERASRTCRIERTWNVLYRDNWIEWTSNRRAFNWMDFRYRIHPDDLAKMPEEVDVSKNIYLKLDRTLNDLRAINQAFANGSFLDAFMLTNKAIHLLNESQERIQEEPQKVEATVPLQAACYRPWTIDEVPIGVGVVQKSERIKCLIGTVYPHIGMAMLSGWGLVIPQDLYECWQQLDGTPCGKEKTK